MFGNREAVVIDESPMLRNFIASALRRQLKFNTVHVVGSADEARRVLRDNSSIEWVFSEMQLSGRSGCDFLSELRKTPATQNIFFIMITATNDKASLMKAIQAGVNDYIVKPFNEDVLARKVNRLLAQQA